MVTLSKAYLLVVFVFACSGIAGTPLSSDINSELNELLSAELTDFQNETGLSQGGMAVFVSTPDEDYFGSAGIGSDVSEGFHFRGASTTKTFTAAAVMFLYSQGLLEIDDSVADVIPGRDIPYLPESSEYDIPFKNQITIRQLLGHRAGVFDVSNDCIPETAEEPYAGQNYIEYIRDVEGDNEHTFTFDELVGVVADNDLSYWAPGAGFHYSNTGYAMLGKIIERVSGMSYREYIRTTFTEPLNLMDTSFPETGSDTCIPEPFIDGYTLFDGEMYETTQDNMSPHVAEGNVITTFSDLSRWIKLLLSGEAGLDTEVVQEMMNVQPTGEHHVWYGLGITYTSGLGFGHNGAHIGYMTILRYDPADSVTVVMMASFLAPEYFQRQGDMLIELALKAKEACGYDVCRDEQPDQN